ncbi:hypothetical protein NLU13_6636 [Sarocladium strictum]|uniref:Uncharacterized protein n=1 Tax=Sarocladium strictum TaxID=5046 RepID=A0AA39GG98_SARSR|nr:hypothetical protein NLU13_6636 [Sarocladium strictum]
MTLATQPSPSMDVHLSSSAQCSPGRSSDEPESLMSREGSDSESRPFLHHGSLQDDEKNPDAPSRRRPLWTFLLLLLVVIITGGALAGIAISLSPKVTVLDGDKSGESDAAGGSLDDTVQSHDHAQVSDHVQYHEDIPSNPQMRPSTEYELSTTWDFNASPVMREYFWTIQDGHLNPDGVYRPMMLINNRFPGPLVECNEGDRIIVHVENRAANATSLHFHGLYQNGTNAMDGSVGITQCAIGPGSTFTYNFTVAGQSGTYWYHAHHSVQASDGLLGPVVIHSRDEKTLQELEYASDRVIMVQDHYHNTTAELLMDYLRPRSENDEPVPDNGLINGHGFRDCNDFPGWHCDVTSRSIPDISLAPGQRHRLRFINVGAFAEFQIEIDEHPFYVTEVDGTDVHPEPFHRLNILPAQRYSIVLEANSTEAESFWMRARMVTHCFTTENERLMPEVRAAVRYAMPNHPPATTGPTSKPWSEAIEIICRDLNTSALHPVVPIRPPPADDFVTLRANFMIGDWKLSRGFFNDSTWRANMTHPTLYRLLDANTSSAATATDSIHTNSDLFDSSREFSLETNGIRTVDIAINSFDDGAHPFHLHGHKFFVLAQAHSGYPPAPEEIPQYLETNKLLDNPLRRDVITVEGYGWVLVRVVLDNPGVWAFHCHNAWHAAAGMFMQVLVRRDDVARGHVSEEQREMCQRDGVHLGDRPDDSIWFGDFS